MYSTQIAEEKHYLPLRTKLFVTGEPGSWTEWSDCQADCTDKTKKGTMTRSRKIKLHGKNLEDEVQEVDCGTPCPPGICPTVVQLE